LYRFIGLIGLFLSLTIAFSSAAETAGGQQALPFTLSWTSGVCPKCQTAQSLSEVQFVSPTEAWGIGYVPPGEIGAGAGDYSVVHTRDGGKTWTELPRSYQHNDPPRVSFSGRKQGWIMIADIVEAENRLLQTRDGGAHWRRLPLRDLFVGDVEYLGKGIGHAYSFDIYKKQGMLLSTKDNGRHWQSSPLPGGFSPDHMKFLDADKGVLTGCLNRQQLVVITTTDAGQHWIQVPLDLPNPSSKDVYCAFETDTLGLLDAQHGWILINKHSFPTGDSTSFGMVFQTSDGGNSWAKTFQTTSATEQIELSEAQFLSPKLGFISKSNDPNTAQNGQSDMLLFTVDGGATWSAAKPTPRLWGCRLYSGDLVCAADGKGFSFVQVSPARAP